MRGGRGSVLERGEHACALYRSDEEHWEIAADFLGAGLVRGEQVLCLDDGGTADAVLRRLGEDGMDLRPYRERGQLIVEPVQLPPRAAGFSAPQFAARFSDRVDDALEQGYPGLRFAFETGSFLRDTGDVDWLLEIDAACAPIWAAAPVAALCQIDERLTSAAQHAMIRLRHGWEIDAPAYYDDGMLRITDDRGRRRLAGEIDLHNREALRTELNHAVDLGCDRIRLAVTSLRFVDAAALGVLADVAAALPTGRRIVVERPGAVLRRLLSVCDVEQLPGLLVESDTPEVVS